MRIMQLWSKLTQAAAIYDTASDLDDDQHGQHGNRRLKSHGPSSAPPSGFPCITLVANLRLSGASPSFFR